MTREEIRRKLEEANNVIVNDYSDFEYGLASDGGHYIYSTVYEKQDDGSWKVYYTTSSSFEYCSKCGSFHDEDSCPAEHKVISTDELIDIIEYYLSKNDEDLEIEFE